MEFLIYRFIPDRDARPRMQHYEVALQPTDRMLLDALERIRTQDDSLAFRRSCREGVCGSDGLNINGVNRLACVPELAELKRRGEKIVMVTAYDAPSGRLADAAGVDLILVGDSSGMVVHGRESTGPVSVDAIVFMTQWVRRGAKRPNG